MSMCCVGLQLDTYLGLVYLRICINVLCIILALTHISSHWGPCHDMLSKIPNALYYLPLLNLCLQDNRGLLAHPVDDTEQGYHQVDTHVLCCVAHLCWQFLPCSARGCGHLCRWSN